MEYLTDPVVYLDNRDFDDEGNMINSNLLSQNKPIMIMIQAKFCGHCTVAKPHYQRFAEKNVGRIICCTIQGDSELPQVVGLGNKIVKICPNFRGYPSYVCINGGKNEVYKGGRSENDLQSYLDSL